MAAGSRRSSSRCPKPSPTWAHLRQVRADHRVEPGCVRESLSREFRSLLDAVPPAKPAEVHKLFVEDLGAEPAELFAEFDEEPFASASIAQVHYAKLRTGEDVVVKIQRPGIRRRVAADLQILKRFAQLVELAKLGRRLSAQDIVADFADNLAEELDFRLEGQSMEAWVAHLHASPLGRNIRVPTVYWNYTTERVLTMERVEGIRIDDAAAIRKAGFDGTELVKALLFSLFEGGLRHGLFHGTCTPAISTSTNRAASCSSTSGSWAASSRAPAGCCASWCMRCWSKRTTPPPARSSC
ncbi:ABC1 family protein [Mycobacterium xenopi 3993]|nr:ABC1 family protein [Mycobacterium xenopi 3993]